jgi:5-methyltetrahydrofolate--homocysteine methyltransferase
VLVFDGATGTSLQQMELSAEDFGGPALEGCNENLVFTRPDAVQAVHRHFLEVGCDVIETDTFGATSIVLAEYDLQDQTFALNLRAAQLAREVADEYSTPEQPRFVAGSIGPTTKLPTLGHIDFDAMVASFREQAEGLIAGDVDLFIVETCQDVLQIKAALQGIEALQRLFRMISIIRVLAVAKSGQGAEPGLQIAARQIAGRQVDARGEVFGGQRHGPRKWLRSST